MSEDELINERATRRTVEADRELWKDGFRDLVHQRDRLERQIDEVRIAFGHLLFAHFEKPEAFEEWLNGPDDGWSNQHAWRMMRDALKQPDTPQ